MRSRGKSRAALAAVLLTLLTAPRPAEPSENGTPDAAVLWREVRRAYPEALPYRDRGKIEVVSVDARGEHRRVVRFETAAGPEGGFRLDLTSDTATGDEGETVRATVWRREGELWVYDATRGEVAPAGSLAAALEAILPTEAVEALVVAELLATGEGPPGLAEATVAGPEPCGSNECRVLTLPAESGALRLWVERPGRRLHRVEREYAAPDWRLFRWVRVHHEVRAGVAAPATTFEPPPETRRVAVLAPRREDVADPPLPVGVKQAPGTAEPGAPAGTAGETPEGIFFDTITVRNVSFAVRVTDPDGQPLPGLGPQDFRVWVGNTEVPLLAAEPFDPARAPAEGLTDGELAELEAWEGEGWEEAEAFFEPEGQQVVLFVQASLVLQHTRGHLRTLSFVRNLLSRLPAEQPVAVVGLGSHLKLFQDFTTDRGDGLRAVERAIRFTGVPEPAATTEEISLAAHLDFEAARRESTAMRSLELLGRALGPIPGRKEIVWIGWGLDGRDFNVHRYRPAFAALDAAGATVHALNVGGIRLAWGLELLAEAGGGIYGRTAGVAGAADAFPDFLIERLLGDMRSAYLLTLDGEAVPAEGGTLRVRLAERRRGEVRLPPLEILAHDTEERH